MKINFKSASFLFFLVLFLISTGFAKDDFSSREIIIKLKPNNELTSFQKAVSENQSTPILLKNLVTEAEIKPIFSAIFKKATQFNPNNYYKITLPESTAFDEILSKLQKLDGVEYAQPNHVYYIDEIPDDPEYAQQWGLQSIRIEPAWEITEGSRDVLITVIDTGIDYDHGDLKDNLFINPGEDLNGNGQVDADDFNQIDDDANGFVDDIRGWDFTDAPGYPDNGDYLLRDNDPADEHGHGTAIAGIIGAVGNNGLGIVGVAPNCRILNLRAGTASGLLEEEDVASAIVYAISMGSRVINMSFGDKVVSPLFRDLIQLAAQNGCTIVASSGNSYDDTPHFPSGYPETISVGAITQSEVLASYSNYGVTIDLVAPGSDILSTGLNNAYQSFSGTSAAAPFVTGVVGLLFSQNPDLAPEEIKGILTATATDLGASGWDAYYAAGNLNAHRALLHESGEIVEITEPYLEQGLNAEKVTIRGTVAGALLDFYELNYGVGVNPNEYLPITTQTRRQVVNDSLGVWLLNGLADTTYTLQLRLVNQDGSSIEDKTVVFVDHSAPEISGVTILPMVYREQQSTLIEFSTDDVCQVSLFFRLANSMQPFEKLDLDYISRTHRVHLTLDEIPGAAEFYIQAANRSNILTVDDNQELFYQLMLDETPVNTANFVRVGDILSSGFFLSKVSDFNDNAQPEIIINEYSENKSYGPLKIYEMKDGEAELIFTSPEIAIPRDWGDADGDGKFEILTTQGPVTTVLEAPEPGGFPTTPVWEQSENFWGSRFTDLDQDGKGEIVGRIDNTFFLYETTGDNQFALIDSFPNFTEGSNGTGVPHCETGDFDGDGFREILLGDYDGDIYIYESHGDDEFRPTWSERLPLLDTIDYLCAGDFNGDGITEFAVGCHSDPDLDLEHQYDSRHWLWRIYARAGNDSYEPVWEQRFFGFYEPKDFDSGVSSADYDCDGKDEIFLCLFPQVYLVDFDSIKQNYFLSWYHSPGQSATALVMDYNGDGKQELIFNDGQTLNAFQQQSNSSQTPFPLGLNADIRDTNCVRLSWIATESAECYHIFRKSSAEEWTMLAETILPDFVDSTVIKRGTYQYSVSALRNGIESEKSPVISVQISERPFLKEATALSERYIQLVFSELLDETSAKNLTCYQIDNDSVSISSVCVHQSGQSLILTAAQQLTAQQSHSIRVSQVRDVDGMPINPLRNQAVFSVHSSPDPPYLVSVSTSGANAIVLEFNEPLNSESIQNLTQFKIKPALQLESFVFDQTAPQQIILNLHAGSQLGAYGTAYVIQISGVKNLAGIEIRKGWGDQAALTFIATDLSRVCVFPNPFRQGIDEDGITFGNLTKQAKIRILNLSGKLITTLEETDGNGGLNWDVTDSEGRKLPSGIYLFYVTSGGEKKVGKFALIR